MRLSSGSPLLAVLLLSSLPGAAFSQQAYITNWLAGGGGGSGTTAGFAGGNGAAALFNNPGGLAAPFMGTIMVADSSNNVLRQINMTSGVVTNVTVLAGGGGGGTSPGFINSTVSTLAAFNQPVSIRVTASGTTAYVSDASNNAIRAIDIATGAVGLLAGGGVAATGSSGSADGTGPSALFNSPQDAVPDSSNAYVYVADTNNNKLRRIVVSTGVVTTIAGSGAASSVNGGGTSAGFYYPVGLAITSDNSKMFVADSRNNQIRVVVMLSYAVTTLAGSGSRGMADGSGPAAMFFNPTALAIDPADANLYVADTFNNAVRKITVGIVGGGVVTTLAGAGYLYPPGLADGVGSAALFNSPTGIAVDSAGSIFVSDTQNQRIRSVIVASSSPSASVSTSASISPSVSASVTGSSSVSASVTASTSVSASTTSSASVTASVTASTSFTASTTISR